jgi:cell division protein FtsB
MKTSDDADTLCRNCADFFFIFPATNKNMEQQINEPVQRSKNILTIIISVLGAVLIAGGGAFLWQQSKITSLQNDLQNLKSNLQNQTAQSQSENEILKQQINDLQSKLNESKDVPISKTDNNSSVYCIKEPTPTEIGRDIYPINIKKYGDIGFLGELFTADDCGSAQVSKIFGVSGNNYTLWPDIGLRSAPSKELLSVLQSIGFELGSTCSDSQNRNTCTHWSLKKTVPLSEILKLKPYAKEIKSSGCINCG